MADTPVKASGLTAPEPTPLRCAGPGAGCLGDVLHMGLIQIGPIQLAVPTQYLREAIDFPTRLSRMLSTSPHVAGAVDVRGSLIPVIDLRPALGLAPADDPQRRIIIISHRGYLFGVVVDELGGVISVQASQCRPVEVLSPESRPLIRELFSVEAGTQVISVLCLEGTMHLCDVPLTVNGPGIEADSHQKTTQRWSPYVLFESGSTRLAIDANMVDTVINLDGLTQNMNRSDTCLGVLHTETRRTAVLNTLQLLKLGSSHTQSDHQVLVLRVDGHAVGLLIRKVSGIARLNDALTRPVPTMAFVAPELFEGLIPLEGEGDFLKISAQQLASLPEVSSMASIHGKPLHEPVSHTSLNSQGLSRPSAGREHNTASEVRTVYLTYRVGMEVATPLKQIREILPIPPGMTPIGVSGDARMGFFAHRDQVVPVIDLCRLMGSNTDPLHPESRLLLVDAQHGMVALRVEQVHAIEHADWEHAPIGADQLSRMAPLQAALHTCTLLTLRDHSGATRGVPSIDLARVAHAIEASYLEAQAPYTRKSEAITLARPPEPLLTAPEVRGAYLPVGMEPSTPLT